MSLIVNNTPKSIISEQFRTIRTNIQFSMVDKTLKTLTVTSSGPNSEKTIISANLVATFAQENQRVLLVDSDLRKPTLHKLFNVKNFEGLSTLIANQTVMYNWWMGVFVTFGLPFFILYMVYNIFVWVKSYFLSVSQGGHRAKLVFTWLTDFYSPV